MLFDGGSTCYFQGKATHMLEYLTPHNLDFQVVDINLSALNPKDPKAVKPVMVFDKKKIDFTLSKSPSELPSKEVNVFAVSKKVKQFVTNMLGYTPSEIQVGKRIQVKANKDVRIVARPSANCARDISQIDEDLNMFKAVGLYSLEYLFKTRAGGYFIALSGGSDSTLNALFLKFACQSLNYFMYQKANQEIIDKLSYIMGLPVSLKKVSLTESQKQEKFFLSGRDILTHPEWYALSSLQKKVEPEDTFLYLIGDNLMVNEKALASKILNTAYLPMSFSGVTKPFVEKLVEQLKCNFQTFHIQSTFDEMKKEAQDMLVK